MPQQFVGFSLLFRREHFVKLRLEQRIGNDQLFQNPRLLCCQRLNLIRTAVAIQFNRNQLSTTYHRVARGEVARVTLVGYLRLYSSDLPWIQLQVSNVLLRNIGGGISRTVAPEIRGAEFAFELSAA